MYRFRWLEAEHGFVLAAGEGSQTTTRVNHNPTHPSLWSGPWRTCRRRRALTRERWWRRAGATEGEWTRASLVAGGRCRGRLLLLGLLLVLLWRRKAAAAARSRLLFLCRKIHVILIGNFDRLYTSCDSCSFFFSLLFNVLFEAYRCKETLLISIIRERLYLWRKLQLVSMCNLPKWVYVFVNMKFEGLCCIILFFVVYDCNIVYLFSTHFELVILIKLFYIYKFKKKKRSKLVYII